VFGNIYYSNNSNYLFCLNIQHLLVLPCLFVYFRLSIFRSIGCAFARLSQPTVHFRFCLAPISARDLFPLSHEEHPLFPRFWLAEPSPLPRRCAVGSARVGSGSARDWPRACIVACSALIGSAVAACPPPSRSFGLPPRVSPLPAPEVHGGPRLFSQDFSRSPQS
jgi:hypothetical protein